MISEKAFYAIVVAIILVGGIGIGVAYYKEVSTTPSTPSHELTTSLTLVVTANNWFKNATINTTQPAFFVLQPNGQLSSAADIKLPSHTLITLTIIDYDSGLQSHIGPNGISNNSTYARVIGTVGGVEYIYNGTSPYINGTLSGNSSNNMSISRGSGWAVTSMPWVGGSSGGWEVTHTFSIIQNGQIMLNVPTFGGTNPSGGATQVTQFYLNSTGTFIWQCFAPCGIELNGWGGAMATAGWMTGVVQVI